MSARDLDYTAREVMRLTRRYHCRTAGETPISDDKERAIIHALDDVYRALRQCGFEEPEPGTERKVRPKAAS